MNVDVPSPTTFLASDRPDLVKKLRTTADAYYARHADVSIESLRRGPRDQESVCDRFGSFDFLPVNRGEVDYILVRHAFEHLSLTEARRALDNMHRTLKANGMLTIDVPDHIGTLQLFQATKDPFYVRHLLGPRRGDDFGHHVMSYEPQQLKALVEDHGFDAVLYEKNIHIFPAICITCQKA